MNLNYIKLSSFMKIEDFTDRYKHSNLDMFHYLNSFKNEINIINKLDTLYFWKNHACIKQLHI